MASIGSDLKDKFADVHRDAGSQAQQDEGCHTEAVQLHQGQVKAGDQHFSVSAGRQTFYTHISKQTFYTFLNSTQIALDRAYCILI